jgi:hypothetical protein
MNQERQKLRKRMVTQSTKLRRTFMNTNVIDSDTPLTEAKGHCDILRSILAALGKGKITEFVEGFGDHFTYTDHALNLQFTDKGRLSEFLKKSREQFPDAKVEVVSTFESGNSANAEWRVTATEKGGLRLKAGSIADFLLGRVDRADSE